MVKKFNSGLSPSLKRRITRFDKAAQEYAFRGIHTDEEVMDMIDDDYVRSRQALEKAIVLAIKGNQ